ncbi:MAG: hypothetical protein SFY70_05095 [Bacteroidia bacterium]|nr:hypothetical protein [Bacteroidia bacterium]
MKQLVLLALLVLTSGVLALAQPKIVINEVYNDPGSPSVNDFDYIELLVLQDNLNLNNYIIKDFSSNATEDGGGYFIFNNSPTWTNLRSGTIIVLQDGGTNVDTVTNIVEGAGADWVIDVAMPLNVGANKLFRTTSNDGMNIGNREIILIRDGGATPTTLAVEPGEVNPAYTGGFRLTGIHPFEHAMPIGSISALPDNGTNLDAQILSLIRSYLLTTGAEGDTLRVPQNLDSPNITATALTPNQEFSDYTALNQVVGTTSIYGAAATATTRGVGNNANNTAFINSLRAITSNDAPFARNRNTLEVTAYPNPIAIGNTSKVTFNLPAADEVSLELVDATGKAVRELLAYTPMAAGEHTVAFTPTSADPLGLHFVVVKARTSGSVGYRKILLLNW